MASCLMASRSSKQLLAMTATLFPIDEHEFIFNDLRDKPEPMTMNEEDSKAG